MFDELLLSSQYPRQPSYRAFASEHSSCLQHAVCWLLLHCRYVQLAEAANLVWQLWREDYSQAIVLQARRNLVTLVLKHWLAGLASSGPRACDV